MTFNFDFMSFHAFFKINITCIILNNVQTCSPEKNCTGPREQRKPCRNINCRTTATAQQFPSDFFKFKIQRYGRLCFIMLYILFTKWLRILDQKLKFGQSGLLGVNQRSPVQTLPKLSRGPGIVQIMSVKVKHVKDFTPNQEASYFLSAVRYYNFTDIN